MITVQFHVLYVGQGSANYIEIYDGPKVDSDSIPVTTMLFDMGSTSEATESLGSVQWVIGRLQRMNRPLISALVISHKDSDHVNLVPAVLAAFTPVTKKEDTDDEDAADTPCNKNKLRIDGIFCGNRHENYASVRGDGVQTFLKLAESYLSPVYRVDKEAIFYGDSQTHFEPGQPTQAFWPDPAAKARPSLNNVVQAVSASVLIVNADLPSATPGKATKVSKSKTKKKSKTDPNAGCLVAALVLRGTDSAARPELFIAGGDATACTLNAAVAAITDLHERYTTYHLTTPHHASFRTTMAAYGAKPHFSFRAGASKKKKKTRTPAPHVVNLQAEAQATSFVNEVQPMTISASASHSNTHTHPSLQVMNLFSKYLRSHFTDHGLDPHHHFISAYVEFEILTIEGTGNKWPPNTSHLQPPVPPHYHTLQTEAPVFTTEYILSEAEARVSQQYVLKLPEDVVASKDTNPGRSNPARVDWTFESTDSFNRSIGRRRHEELDADEEMQDAGSSSSGSGSGDSFRSMGRLIPARVRRSRSPIPQAPPMSGLRVIR